MNWTTVRDCHYTFLFAMELYVGKKITTSCNWGKYVSKYVSRVIYQTLQTKNTNFEKRLGWQVKKQEQNKTTKTKNKQVAIRFNLLQVSPVVPSFVTVLTFSTCKCSGHFFCFTLLGGSSHCFYFEKFRNTAPSRLSHSRATSADGNQSLPP